MVEFDETGDWGKCSLCGQHTVCEYKGAKVCCVCCGKHNEKQLEKKLDQLEIEYDKEEESKSEPFKCHLEYSGGTKNDIVNMIMDLIDQHEIWDEIRERL